MSYRDKSVPNSMIIVSDGDVIRNDINPKNGQPLPLGFDPYQGAVVFDNSEFLMNCMNHLLNDKAVISLRTRTFKSRLLNFGLVEKYESLIKFLNVGLPLLVMILLGLVMYVIRRRRFSK